MIEVYGVDLGVRKAHFFGIGPDNETELFSAKLDKSQHRGFELQKIFYLINDHFKDVNAAFYIEEPPLAGMKNVRVFMKLAQISGVVAVAVPRKPEFVPVSEWKKQVVGKGNAKKEDIKSWLCEHYQYYSAQCERTDSDSQDYSDAACLAIYGSKVLGIDI